MDERAVWMRRALALAVQSVEQAGGPFGAVIVRDGKVLGEGANRVTHLNDPTAHAEVEAIRAACKALGSFSLTGATLYTSCEPCPMCLAACYWARIEAIYFAADQGDAAAAGFDDAFIYRQLGLPLAERSLEMSPLDLPEKLMPFQAWQAKTDKMPY